MSCRVWGNEFNFRCYQCWYKQMCLFFCVQMCKPKHMPQTKREDAETHTHRDCTLTLSKQSHRVFEEISYKWMRYRISRKMNGDMGIGHKDKTHADVHTRKKRRNHHRSAIGMKSPMKYACKCGERARHKNELLIGSFYRFMCHIKTINSYLS